MDFSSSNRVDADLERSISRARIVLSLATLVSVYLDPAIGGRFSIEPPLLTALFVHLSFALAVTRNARRHARARSAEIAVCRAS